MAIRRSIFLVLCSLLFYDVAGFQEKILIMLAVPFLTSVIVLICLIRRSAHKIASKANVSRFDQQENRSHRQVRRENGEIENHELKPVNEVKATKGSCQKDLSEGSNHDEEPAMTTNPITVSRTAIADTYQDLNRTIPDSPSYQTLQLNGTQANAVYVNLEVTS